jgi:hypothetical protein
MKCPSAGDCRKEGKKGWEDGEGRETGKNENEWGRGGKNYEKSVKKRSEAEKG